MSTAPAPSLELVKHPIDAGPSRKLPFLKFFASDWRSDPKLRACGLAARGLWIEMIGLMHEANPRGYLRINGHPPNEVELARQVGAVPREVRAALAELRKNDVLSVTADGILYSRRMLRDARRGIANGKNGQKGAAARWNRGHADHDGERNGEQHGEVDGENHGPRSQNARSQNPLPPSGDSSDEEIDQRAGVFLERYPEMYARCRDGATYRVSRLKQERDLDYARELVRGWPDDRLLEMLEIFLRRTDLREKATPGTPGQFLHMAPDCDRLLREHGR